MKNYSQFAKEHLLISRGKGVSILDYEAFLSDVQLHFPNHLFYPEIENGLHYSELYEKLKQIINSPYPSIITTYSMDAIEFFCKIGQLKVFHRIFLRCDDDLEEENNYNSHYVAFYKNVLCKKINEEISYVCLARNKNGDAEAFKFDAKMLAFGLSKNHEIRL